MTLRRREAESGDDEPGETEGEVEESEDRGDAIVLFSPDGLEALRLRDEIWMHRFISHRCLP